MPAQIDEEPEAYECLDFKVRYCLYIHSTADSDAIQITVDPVHIRTVKERLAPADHPVFELVPPSFHGCCFKFYRDSPTITQDNVWNVYLFILDGFRHLDDHAVDPFTSKWSASFTLGRGDQWGDNALPPVPDQELPQAIGHYYQGGVNSGLGPSDDIQDGPNIAAQFSDDEDSVPKGTYERELEFFDLTGPDPFVW
ncbi:hypothetical protein C8J56DRAFT_1050482 [Mycena floridula]|nr:hypothetical protein C8J56DRAFT_1050482 [Mycena floridula]